MDDARIEGCEGVYYPREDSWLLAGMVRKYAFGAVLDLCTGTGIQGITAAMLGCEATFADIDPKAVECARKNAGINGVRGEFVLSDVFNGIDGRFNTIVCNPPYLSGDDATRKGELALDGGPSGRNVIDKVISGYKEHVLEEHVVLLLESSANGYERDANGLGAEVVAREHYMFEDIVVLKFV